MRKAYRGGVPKPDARGYIRPEIGGHRFNIGHKHDVSEGEARRRTCAIRDLYDQQCKDNGVGHWLWWVLPWAEKLAVGEHLVFPVTDYARNNFGQAGEEATLIERLRSLGLDIASDDPETISNGERKLKQMIDERVRVAVAEAISSAKSRFGSR